MEVHGTVAGGFEAVRSAFGEGAADLGDGGGALCAYVDGERVVDIGGGSAGPGRPWTEETRAVLMSSTKGLATLCVHILYDRGKIDVDAPVARYWPEFGRRGKDRITVRQVLSHSAGVVAVPGHEAELGWDGTGYDDLDGIATALAEAEPAWEPGTRHGYHALTFGWIPTVWALGYMGSWGYPGTPKRFGPHDEAFGHAGAGGQVGFCDPPRRVAVGFVRNELTLLQTFSAALFDTLYACIG